MDKTGEVKLAHFSVKEYLLSKRHQNVPSSFCISETSSHSFISQTCLAYLLQFDKPDCMSSSMIHKFPLAQYAAQYWTFHAQAGRDDSSDALQKLTVHLLQSQHSPPFITWVQLWDLDNPWQRMDLRRKSTEIPPPLYYASLAGLVQAVQTLMEKGGDVNAQAGCYGNALQAASCCGHEAIVKLLLEGKADVNAQGGEYSNTLQAALSGGLRS